MFHKFSLLTLLLTLTCTAQASNPLGCLEPELEKFSRVLSTQIGLNNDGQDVHILNTKLKEFAPLIRKCNALLLLDQKQDSNKVLDDFSRMEIEHGFGDGLGNKVKLDDVLNELRIHLAKGSDYDKETDMHVSHLLSATRNYFAIAYFHNPETILSVISFYFKQNRLEQGQCFPGYAGRLMVANGLFILEMREILKIWPDYINDIKNCTQLLNKT